MDQPAEVVVAEDGRLRQTLANQPKTDEVDGWILDALINSDGSLSLEDYGFGSLAWEMFGDSDVEVFLRTRIEYRDKILLLLVREFLTREKMSIHTFKDWLAAHGIPFELHTF